MLKRLVTSFAIFLYTAVLGCGGSSSPTPTTPIVTPPPASTGSYSLVWSDEFNGTNGTAPDSTKWTLETGGNGWGNNELEYYTNRTENAHQQDGNLLITAISENYTGSDSVTRSYTSARLKTQAKFEQAYGKFEARIKIPAGQGIWPAFWMLGNDVNTAGWPNCGELDIMENVGFEPSMIHGSMHGPGYSGGNPLTASYALSGGQSFSSDFHVFAVEWEPNTVRFYVDGNLFSTQTNTSMPSGGRWVFDHPFFMLLNVAVGGNWPGSPNGTTQFPQSMVVDYVRVYTKS
jgi:beta-glucanase (GH16 family)